MTMSSEEFKRCFLPYHKVLYRVAFHLVGNVHDAQDLLQDFYLLLWQKRGEMDESRRTQAYLVTMLRNMHIDRARKVKRRFVEVTDETLPPDGDNPERQLIHSDEGRHIRSLIDDLPERDRKVISLHAEEGMSYREMEEATGLRQGNLRVIVLRTREKLKTQFINISKSWKS